MLANQPNLPRTAKDQILEKESVHFFKKRFDHKQKQRQKAKENVDKRVKLRDEEKVAMSGFETKRENFVYLEGTSYTVRWSSLPRFII